MAIPTSILICTRNRAAHLRDTLRALGKTNVPEFLDPEVVVVDNGSTDATAEVLAEPPVPHMPVRSVLEPETGVARARNTALREARGHILLWLDDDVHVPSDWMAPMTRPILKGSADAVAGKVVLAPHLTRPWMEPFHRTTLAATEGINPKEPRDIISANMALSRTVFQEIEGFDPELGPGGRVGALEDTLFSWQLREAGYRIQMVCDAPVEHHFDEFRLTRPGFIRAAIDRGRSLAYIHYHWLHRREKNWTHRERRLKFWRHPYLVFAKRFADSLAHRLQRRFVSMNCPITRREFFTIANTYSIKQYIKERKKEKYYDKKGLVKKGGLKANT